jgi:hypothetical protein
MDFDSNQKCLLTARIRSVSMLENPLNAGVKQKLNEYFVVKAHPTQP